MDLIPAVSIRKGRVVCADCDDYRDMGKAIKIIRKLSEEFQKILVIDIDAIECSEPQFDLIQELSEEDFELWLDVGVRNADDLVHPFVTGATVVVAGTKAVRSLDAFAEMYRVSGEVVPSIEVKDGKVVWGGSKVPSFDVVLARLREFGYKRLVVADFGRRQAHAGLDSASIGKAAAGGFEVFAGGGVTKDDAPALETLGAKGALLEFRSVWNERP